MNFKRLSAAILTLSCVLLLIVVARAKSDEQATDLTTLSDSELKAVVIRMERLRCYGTCPAYSVTIHGDGQVEYLGKDHVKEKTTKTSHLEAGVIRSLMSEFARASFLSVPEDYPSEKCGRYCTDMPTAVTELTVKGTTHRVKHYYGCAAMPKALFDLEAAIDESANTQQWTGDVSKAGPFATTCWGG